MQAMSTVTASLARETISALAPAARAFTKAQNNGHVWIGEQGSFETIEMFDTAPTPKTPNPDQLRLI